MQYAKITVSGNQAIATELLPITAGTVGGTVAFQFDESWEGFTKTLVWRGSGVIVDDINCTGIIPAKVLEKPNGPLLAGVYGTKDGTVTPTVWAELGLIQMGADPSGDEAADPALPVWAQIRQTAQQADTAAQQAQTAAQQAQTAAAAALESLSDCVRKDDYYGKAKPGLMTIAMYDTGGGGLIPTNPETIPGGVIICRATNADIDERTQKYKPIVPYNLDYAVHSVLGKQPEFISAYTGDKWEDGAEAVNGYGDYIGQIRLQGGYRHSPKRVWLYIGRESDDEYGLPVWIDLLSGETFCPI